MDNLWIYIVIFLIIIIRSAIKQAEKQRKQAENNSQTPDEHTEEWGEWREWGEVFPVEKIEIPSKEPEKDISVAEPEPVFKPQSEPLLQPVAEPAKKIATPAISTENEDKSGGQEPFFKDREDLKRGIIAAEILNRKY